MRSLWLEWSFEQCANATSSLIPFFKALHLAAALCACTESLTGIGAAQITYPVNIPSRCSATGTADQIKPTLVTKYRYGASSEGDIIPLRR
jgi:hypothetical protein